MSLGENKAMIRRYFEAIAATCQTGNADLIDEYLAPDFVEHSPFLGIPPIREGWKQVFLMFDMATPGYYVIEDLLAENDKVVGQIMAHGTHIGELFGIPATGKQARMSAIVIWRVRDGKIVEHWHNEFSRCSRHDSCPALRLLGSPFAPTSC